MKASFCLIWRNFIIYDYLTTKVIKEYINENFEYPDRVEIKEIRLDGVQR